MFYELKTPGVTVTGEAVTIDQVPGIWAKTIVEQFNENGDCTYRRTIEVFRPGITKEEYSRNMDARFKPLIDAKKRAQQKVEKKTFEGEQKVDPKDEQIESLKAELEKLKAEKE